MKNNYPLENIYWQQFEELTILICKDILGIAAKTFSDGRDGGRDSFFEGTAQKVPSETAPWQGKFVIQAKHTGQPGASCSDSDFSGTGPSSIVTKEIQRLKKLNEGSPFNCYLLFTNRKLTGDKHPELISRLRNELSIQNVEIVGYEDINGYITDDIADKVGLTKFSYPLRFYEKDIQDVVLSFEKYRDSISGDKISDQLEDFREIDKVKKNELNRLGSDYFEHIKQHSLSHFSGIEDFLKDPKNKLYTLYYENTVSDLQAKVEIERSQFAEFERVIEYLIDQIVNADFEKLKDSRRLVRVFLHFMYFNCDIGRKQ